MLWWGVLGLGGWGARRRRAVGSSQGDPGGGQGQGQQLATRCGWAGRGGNQLVLVGGRRGKAGGGEGGSKGAAQVREGTEGVRGWGLNVEVIS